jgi:hypothetical protein
MIVATVVTLVTLIGAFSAARLVLSNRTTDPGPAEQEDRGPLSFLEHPQDDESWAAGEDLATEMLSSERFSEKPAEHILLAFWSSKESTTFFVSDAINQALYKMPDITGAIAVDLPSRPQTDPLLAQTQTDSFQLLHDGIDHQVLGGSNILVPMFRDSSFRVWRASGSPQWPAVLLVNIKSGHTVRSWSGRDFVRQWLDTTSALDKAGRDRNKETIARPGQLPLFDLRDRVITTRKSLVDAATMGSSVVVVDAATHKLRKTDVRGNITEEWGAGAPGWVDGHSDQAQFRFPHRVAHLSAREMFVIADWGNLALRSMNTNTKVVTTVPLPEGLIPHDIASGSNKIIISDLLLPRLWIASSTTNTEASDHFSFTSMALPGEFGSGSVLSPAPDNRMMVTSLRTGARIVVNLTNGEWNSVLPLGSGLLGGSLRQSAFSWGQNLWVHPGKKDRPIFAQNHEDTAANPVALDLSLIEDSFPSDAEDGIGITGSNSDTSPDSLVLWRQEGSLVCVVQSESALSREGSQQHCKKILKIDFPKPAALSPAEVIEKITLKAGTKSTIRLKLEPPDGYNFSDRDIHSLTTPDERVVAWSPSGQQTLQYLAPQKPGPGSFIFLGVVCKKNAPRDCAMIEKTIHVEIRMSFHQAEARASMDLTF